jgi:hypothetical protein
MIRILLCLCFLWSLTLPCAAFKNGFYSHMTPDESPSRKSQKETDVGTEQISANPILTQIFTTANHADRTIHCASIDAIDIGVGRMSGNAMSPIYFKRDEIHEFLKRETHKDLLVVWFWKSIMWKGPTNVQEVLSRIKGFVSDLEYKRVLVLGAHALGLFVVYDSIETESESTTKEK